MAQFRDVTVHVAGHYVPTCTGLDALEEVCHFRELFWKSNARVGAMSAFLMGMKGDPPLTQDYVAKRVKKGDVFVLLNPTGDLDSTSYMRRYTGVVLQVSRSLGKQRLVLAFQSAEVRRSVRSHGLSMGQLAVWEISHTPLIFWEDGREVVRPCIPAPEEAMRIVAAIITGDNPDVYEESV